MYGVAPTTRRVQTSRFIGWAVWLFLGIPAKRYLKTIYRFWGLGVQPTTREEQRSGYQYRLRFDYPCLVFISIGYAKAKVKKMLLKIASVLIA